MQHGIQRNYFYSLRKRHFQKRKFAQSPSNEFLFTFTQNATFFDKGNVENTNTGSHLGFQ